MHLSSIHVRRFECWSGYFVWLASSQSMLMSESFLRDYDYEESNGLPAWCHAIAVLAAFASVLSVSVPFSTTRFVFLLERLNSSSWFLTQGNPSTYSTLRCKEIRVPLTRSVLPFGTLCQTLPPDVDHPIVLSLLLDKGGHSLWQTGKRCGRTKSASLDQFITLSDRLCLQQDERGEAACRAGSSATGMIFVLVLFRFLCNFVW